MKILFDANTPAPLAWHLRGHQVTLADQIGWESFADGRLLDVAERDGSELLLTCDQNFRYQQNFTGRSIAVLMLSTNHWPTIRKAAARVATAVDFVQPGTVTRFEV